MQQPLASLNMASRVIYRYTRVRAVAFGFVSQVNAQRCVCTRSQVKKHGGLYVCVCACLQLHLGFSLY